MRESEILKTCLAILHARGVFAWRNNTGAFAGTHNGVRRFVRFGRKGASDIIGVLPDGRFLAVETKAPGKRPSVDQIAFMKAINEQGGVAFWTCSTILFCHDLKFVLAGGAIVMDDDGEYEFVGNERGAM